jgi:chaperonin cofactor prefoldin
MNDKSQSWKWLIEQVEDIENKLDSMTQQIKDIENKFIELQPTVSWGFRQTL